MSVTWDVSFLSSSTIISNNYLTAANAGASELSTRSTISKLTGKWFNQFSIAVTAVSLPGVGICNASKTAGGADLSQSLNSLGYYADGNIYSNGAGQLGTGVAYTVGDVIDMALDLDNKKVWFRKGSGGLWNGSGTDNPATNTGGYSLLALPLNAGPYFVGVDLRGAAITANFGLTSTAPLGFAGWDPDGAAGFILSDTKNRLIYTAEVTTFSVPARIGA